MVDWSKKYWVSEEEAININKLYNIGFDQYWPESGKFSHDNYGHRIIPKIQGLNGKYRVHQDSIDIYEGIIK